MGGAGGRAGVMIGSGVKGARISYVAVPERPEGHGSPCSAKLRCTAESEFEILCRLERDFFSVEDRIRGKFVSFHSSDEQINFHGANIFEYPWQDERLYPAQSANVDRLRLVSEQGI